jgi:hypothetical protein
MTAILGFNCSDGVLLFADTEVSIGDIAKVQGDKLRYIRCPHGMIITGGSGDVYDIEYANFRLERELLQEPMTSIDDIYLSLEGLLQNILDCHKRPLNIEMLLAVHPFGGTDTRMFTWRQDLLTLISPHKHRCAGSGVIQLDPLLRQIEFVGDSKAMLLYGVSLMLQTKRMVQGVGGNTEALLLTNGMTASLHGFGRDVAQQIEVLVAEMEDYSIRFVTPFIAGKADSEEQVDGALATIAVTLKVDPFVKTNIGPR